MASIQSVVTAKEPERRFRDLDLGMKKFLAKSTVTLFAIVIAVALLLPLAFMVTTALKSEDQITSGTILPRSPTTLVVTEGEFAGSEYELFAVPLPDGSTQDLALVQPGRERSVFVDPAAQTVPIEWEGRWRTLDPVTVLDPTFGNFGDAWEALDFLQVLFNTGVIAGFGMAGTVIASTLVAYGLSRFYIPGKRVIMASLVATIILPPFVTLVPTYALWLKVGLVGTWWPLIVPHFFGNAYNVFLLRQFFLSIPRDLDEAAAIDGANPFRTLITVILPQAKGAVLAVSLFHFFFAWNDFINPVIYLPGRSDLQPISVALSDFFGVFSQAVPLVQAGAMLSMAVPILVFLSLQRIFLGGIDLSGSIK